jgi:hypothetical protein
MFVDWELGSGWEEGKRNGRRWSERGRVDGGSWRGDMGRVVGKRVVDRDVKHYWR